MSCLKMVWRPYRKPKLDFQNDVQWRMWVTYKLGQHDVVMRIVIILISALFVVNTWSVFKP